MTLQAKPDLRAALAGLGDDRIAIVADARDRGCNLDKWRPFDWQLVADAITRLEDRLEYEVIDYPRRAERLAPRRQGLKVLRRSLEDACDAQQSRKKAA